MAVYLHRDLPAPASCQAVVLRPGTQGAVGDARPATRWADQLPAEHELTTPATGATPAYARIGELAEFVRRATSFEADEFASYQLDVAYPLFGMEYVMAFEF